MNALLELDEKILLSIIEIAGTWAVLDSFLRIVVNDYFVPVVLSLVLFGLWFWGKDQESRERNQRTVLCAGAALGVVNIIVKISNFFCDRDRPFVGLDELWVDGNNMVLPPDIFYPPTDPSFPSNMAAIVFAVVTVVWLSNRRLGAVLLIPGLLVCFARLVAGVHYPLDVLAGACLGILCAYLTHDIIMRLLEPLTKAILRVARKLCLA